uniref:Uncharacterized protein n=1 Tax=Caenorhabditis japonica TaxID=281687 RepID=A0A8R1IGB5_CAEJA
MSSNSVISPIFYDGVRDKMSERSEVSTGFSNVKKLKNAVAKYPPTRCHEVAKYPPKQFYILLGKDGLAVDVAANFMPEIPGEIL